MKTQLETVLREDPRWSDVFGYDERRRRSVFLRKPPFPDDVQEGGPAHREKPYPRDVSETDVFRVQIVLERENGLYSTSSRKVDGAIDRISRERSFDPVRRYLDSLKWDGISRVWNWMSRYLGAAEDQNTCAAGSAWFDRAVSCVYRPGRSAGDVLILEGSKTGKTQTVKALGGDWYRSVQFRGSDKESRAYMATGWIVELEFDFMEYNKKSMVASFLSASGDVVGATTHPRRCVFMGTTSLPVSRHEGDLFCRVRTNTIDIEALLRDRDQLWAEAVAQVFAKVN